MILTFIILYLFKVKFLSNISNLLIQHDQRLNKTFSQNEGAFERQRFTINPFFEPI